MQLLVQQILSILTFLNKEQVQQHDVAESVSSSIGAAGATALDATALDATALDATANVCPSASPS